MADEFNIYRGQDGNIDYETVVATMDLADTSVEIPDQDLPPGTTWHYVRRQVSECELESEPSDACIVRIDGDGDMIPNLPNAPQNLTAEQLAGARIKLRWRYNPAGQEVQPVGFRVFIDSGGGFDFEAPDATVSYAPGGFGFEWTSDALVDGNLYSFCVRVYAASSETPNTSYVTITARSTGPAAITGLIAEVE